MHHGYYILFYITLLTPTLSLAKANTQQDKEFAELAMKLNLDQQELDFIIEGKLNEIKSNNTNELKGAPSWVTVGNDVSCDYRTGNNRIQQAIDHGNTEIRIATGVYEENILIDDKDVKLLGGYADCQAADNNDYNSNSTATVIRPVDNSGNPAIRVTGNSTRHTITLRNLSLENGEASGIYSGGGVSFYNADASVTMQNMQVTQNTGIWGGGVSVQNGNTDINMNGVIISNNNASVGGGIYCIGNDNLISYDNSSGVASLFGNSATSNGGGVYVTQECTFVNYVGGFLQGIIANTANTNGGGIYATHGAQVTLQGHRSCFTIGNLTFCFGNSEDPVYLISNTADNDIDNDGNGGAIYATGSNTRVIASNVSINDNSAVKGGAVYLEDGAEFETYSANPKTCWDKGNCNKYFNNNASTTNGHGGAFYVSDGSTLSVKTTRVTGNKADFGSGFYVKDTDSTLKLEGSYVVNNDGNANYSNNYPIRVTSGAEARIDYTTIADNAAAIASIGNSSSTLRIYNSIIHDLNGAPALSENSAVVSVERCIIVNNMGDVSSGSYNIVDDPEFVNRASNDYHIDALFSPAVDYCDENQSQAQHTTTDMDGEERGWDDPVATENYQGSYYDAGADETYGNDIIFKDGFE